MGLVRIGTGDNSIRLLLLEAVWAECSSLCRVIRYPQFPV
jgi:hypothetical protein